MAIQIQVQYFQILLFNEQEFHMKIERIGSQLNMSPEQLIQGLQLEHQEPYTNIPTGLQTLQFEIDLQMYQREGLFDFHNDDLSLNSYELTIQEQKILDFLLPSRKKKILISNNGMPYPDFITQSLKQYESLQRQQFVTKATAQNLKSEG